MICDAVCCVGDCDRCVTDGSLVFPLKYANLVLEQWSPELFIALFHAMRLPSVPVHSMITDALTDPDKLAKVHTFIEDLRCDTSAEFNVKDFRDLCQTLSEKLENTPHDAVVDPSTTKLFEEYQDMCTKAMTAASQLASVCLGRYVSAADFLVGTKYAIKPPVVATP